MTTPYEMFETLPELERDGVWFDFGGFAIKCAFAGGANVAYQAAIVERRFSALGDEAAAREALIGAYASAVVKDWRDFVGRDGEPVRFTRANVEQAMRDLPHLFDQLQSRASQFRNYRKAWADDVAGKSQTT